MTDTTLSPDITLTPDPIEQAIIQALGDGFVHLWSEVASRVPGPKWQRIEAFCRLVDEGRVDAVVVDGRTFCALPLMSPSEAERLRDRYATRALRRAA